MLLVGLLVAATAVALPLSSVSWAGTQLALLVGALVAFGALLVVERRAPFLTRRLVWIGSATLLAVAVAVPPQGSRDVWAYAMYGRVVSAHHASPYHHPPSQYPTDPLLPRMAPAWRHTPSVYGPAFTLVSAGGTAAAGNSALRIRLFFQLLEALAVLAALLLLERARAGPAALACIGLNPAVVFIVNGAHNDLLLGVAVLAAVLAVRAERGARRAGVLLALGALVKIVGLLPLAAVVAWLVVRRGWRAAATAAGWATGTIVVGYLLAGGRSALSPLAHAATHQSRASLWEGPAELAHHVVAVAGGHGFAVIATGSVLVLAAVVIASRLHDVDPALAAGGSALAYLLAAAYVLPWYSGWALLVLALAWRSRLTALALVQSSVLLVLYANRPGLDPDSLHGLLVTTAVRVVPVVELVAVAALLVASARRAPSALATGPLPRI